MTALALPTSHFKGFASVPDPQLRQMSARHGSQAIAARAAQKPTETVEHTPAEKTAGGAIMSGVGAAVAGAQVGSALGAGATGATQGSAGGWWGAGIGFVLGVASYALS